MLRLKPTFHLYTKEISEQIKKSISRKYIEQIAKGVLYDITKNSGQAGFDNTECEEAGGKIC